MKIVVLQGSPNRMGSTNILVEEFTKGAQEAGQLRIYPLELHPQMEKI